MEEKNVITYKITAFIMAQKIQVINSNREFLEEVDVQYDEVPKTILNLSEQYNVIDVYIRGLPSFRKKVIQDIQKEEITRYSENKLHFI